MDSAFCPWAKSAQPNRLCASALLGCEFDHLFEGSAGLDQVTGLHRRHSLAVKRIRLP